MSYVKINIPDKVKTQIKNVLSDIAETRDSKIRKGMNEVTKSVERGTAKLIVMAEDVTPPEILFHMPILCEEKEVPYAYLSTRKDLGNAVRINVGASSISIDNPGTGNDTALANLIKQLENLRK
jgi:large subunit ribosomal protein L7Ae